MMKKSAYLTSLLQLALLIAPAICSPQPSEGDFVTLSIRVYGLPPTLTSRVYLNGTSSWIDNRTLAVNSSEPLNLELRKGSTVTVALDIQLSDGLGNVYTLSWIEHKGNKYNVVTLKNLNQDVELVASYSWSHMLLHPLLWPFYGLLILLVLHRWLRSFSRRSAEEERTK